MLIVMDDRHAKKDVAAVVNRIKEMGCAAKLISGSRSTFIEITGNRTPLDPGLFEAFHGVKNVIETSQNHYKLASRNFKSKDTIIPFKNFQVGKNTFTVMAGPCAVESEKQLLKIARAVRKSGAHILRGGAFKPRTSPYTFQGLGAEGLNILKLAKEETGLPVVTEAVDRQSLEKVCKVADVIQIGARNMRNFPFLREAGRAGKPVLLKRAPFARLEEWLMSAEYILREGNRSIILCERGEQAIADPGHFNPDLNLVLGIKEASHLPVFVDPSHGTGKGSRVAAMARAAAAVGAHGIIVEVHDQPERSLSDAKQAISIPDFHRLMEDLRSLSSVLGFRL